MNNVIARNEMTM